MLITYQMPAKIIFGKGSLSLLPQEITKYGEKVLLVSGKGKTSILGKEIVKALETDGFQVVPFFQVEPNPSIETVRAGILLALQEQVDMVIAVGGGSPLDAAKAIAASIGSDTIIEELLGIDKVKYALPIIAIPTTSGTGSEVTKYSVLTMNHKKISLVSTHIIPLLAIVDPELTLDLPRNVTIDTGLDALSHLLEGFFSRSSSSISDAYAREGLRWFKYNYEGLLATGDYKYREGLSMASLLGGLTINTAGSGLAHAIGYPLTSNFEVPHGRANAMIMPHLFFWQKSEIIKKYKEASDILGYDDLCEGLIALNKISEIEPFISGFSNISEEIIDNYAEEVINNKRFMMSAPKTPEKEEVINLYRKLQWR